MEKGKKAGKWRMIPILFAVLSSFLLWDRVSAVQESQAEGRTEPRTLAERETPAEPEMAQTGEASPVPEPAQLYAKAAVLMDADTGRVLYGKNENEILPMASTTKIMTCIVALENGSLEDRVTVSAYAASQPKVHLGMRTGQQFVLKDLLYSMMLESHNDSAVAIAEHIGAGLLSLPEEQERSKEDSKRAVAAFVELMNQKARDIGCYDTYFVTPNGLDAVGQVGEEKRQHSTTARDLASIMKYCICQSGQKENFLEITRTPSYALKDVRGKYRYACTNHNAFLSMMDGALSGKTGFTGAAGYCYVGALKRDDKCFTVALLACGWPNHKTWKWSDTKALMNYGLAGYQFHSFSKDRVREEWCQPILVEQGKTEKLGGQAYTEVAVQRADDSREGMLLRSGEEVVVKCEVKKQLEAPVEAGEEVGQISYLVNGEMYRMDLIVTGQSVEAIDFRWCFEQIISRFLL